MSSTDNEVYYKKVTGYDFNLYIASASNIFNINIVLYCIVIFKVA